MQKRTTDPAAPRRAALTAALLALGSLTLPISVSARKPAPRPPVSQPKGDAATQQARKTIQADYDEQDAAFARRDLDAYLAHHAPDFTSVDKDGKKTTDDDTRHTLGMIFKGTQSAKAATRIQGVTLQTDGAVVLTRAHSEMTVERPGDHQVGHIVADTTSRDLWVKADGAWQCKRSKTLTDTTTINGQSADDFH